MLKPVAVIILVVVIAYVLITLEAYYWLSMTKLCKLYNFTSRQHI